MIDPRSAYREAEVSGATPLRLVILLYEQAIEDLRQAGRAMEQKQVEIRTNRINHALDVIARLQVTLDMNQGGGAARKLAGFYEQVRSNLWKAQLCISRPMLLQQITDLLELRQAWIEVEKAESPVQGPSAAEPNAPHAAAAPGQPTSSNWEA